MSIQAGEKSDRHTRYQEMSKNPDFIFDQAIDVADKNSLCRQWLYAWEKLNLEDLRKYVFCPSKWRGKITLLIHSFQSDEEMFYVNEFPILHTWKMLGVLSTVIITDRKTKQIQDLMDRFPNDITIRISPDLKCGDGLSLSWDCLNNLDKYFDTPYCLIIQDDGFPIRDNMDDFLYKWDYIGAPCVKDLPRQYLADILLRDCLNGGFSLRSHVLCTATTKAWKDWGYMAHKKMGWTMSEDWFYSIHSRYNPIHRLRYRFPWAPQARRFSVMDFIGGIDIRKLRFTPFGIHGPTTVYFYRDELVNLGYQSFHIKDVIGMIK